MTGAAWSTEGQRQPTLDFFTPQTPPAPRPKPVPPKLQERHAPNVFIPGTPPRCLHCGFLWEAHPASIKGPTQVASPA